MLTPPNTPAREKQVSTIIDALRERLISADFVSIVINNHTISGPGRDGWEICRATGGFTLTCEVRDDAAQFGKAK